MDTLNLLLDGFANALTPRTSPSPPSASCSAPSSACCPGIGPAMAVALLLPITYGLEPTQSFIMFAGIYYGGMYGGSTTSILLNTPGESASVMTAIEGNKMAKTGRAAQALATAAIGSFVAGTIGTLLVAFLTPALAEHRGRDRRPVVLRDHAALARAGHRVLGSSKLRGFIGLFIGLTHRPRRPRPVDRPGAAHLRHPAARRRHRHRRRRGRDLRHRRGAVDRGPPAPPAGRRHPGRPAVHGPRRLAPLLEAVAARHRARLPLRRAPGRRRRDPDVPVLRDRAKRLASTATSSARAPSRASRARRPPTTPAPPACSSPCSRWACRRPRPPR